MNLNKVLQHPRSVHTEHCCVKHGCKYGLDYDCEVVQGKALQTYACEECDVDRLPPRQLSKYTLATALSKLEQCAVIS